MMRDHFSNTLALLGMLYANVDKDCPEPVRHLVRGKVHDAYNALTDAYAMVAAREPEECGMCGGIGYLGEGPCHECDGEGVRRVGA